MTSLAPFSADEIVAVGARLTGEPVGRAEVIARGRNSLIAHLETASGRHFALKRHRSALGDTRDRLGTERTALTFLAAAGIDCTPRALADDPDWLLLEWIDGTPVGTIGEADIRQTADFAARLLDLSRGRSATALPDASEACFCGGTVAVQIEARLARLRPVGEISAFLGEVAAALAATPSAALSGADIPPDERTLSPSDFGFHNALRRPDGRLAFIDFEYFGWDDPVKLACDFLLHPGMALTTAQKARFAAEFAAVFGKNPGFLSRFQQLLPLYGLRWCMILLNEFVPGRGASWSEPREAAERERRKAEQLAKARRLLAESVSIRESFPYGS
jgi:hypothetical protein